MLDEPLDLSTLSMPINCYEVELEQLMANYNLLPLRDPQRVEVSHRIVELRIELREARDARADAVSAHLRPRFTTAADKAAAVAAELRIALRAVEDINRTMRDYGAPVERLPLELEELLNEIGRLIAIKFAPISPRPEPLPPPKPPGERSMELTRKRRQ